MKVNGELFKEMQEIVGQDFVTTQPAVLDTYAFQFAAQALMGGSVWAYRPVAAVLPGSASEVQAIVRACNRHKAQYKAHSTGWGVYGAAGHENVVQIDLRRMNRIIDIDEKNMIAVVEPYVNGVQLTVETMRKGLTAHIVGAGGNTSVLASVTSVMGQGWTGVYTGFNNRNLLSCEWVMPDGEIMGVGSLGTTGEWFTSTGPGPGMRGVFRGFMGAMGGLGVFTKAAVKLYHWPGPPELAVKGASPDYGTDIPRNMHFYILSWPDWDHLEDAWYQIGEAELGYAMCRNAPSIGAAAITQSNQDFYELWQTGLMQTHPYIVTFILAGNSDREFAWQLEMLHHILDKTGGMIQITDEISPYYAKSLVKLVRHSHKQLGTVRLLKGGAKFGKIAAGLMKSMDGGFKFLNSALFLGHVRNSLNARGVFRFGGSFWTALGCPVTPACAVKNAKVGARVKEEFIKDGSIMDDGADNAWICSYENAHLTHAEELAAYDPSDPRSGDGIHRYVAATTQACIEEALGMNMNTGSDVMHTLTGPHAMNYDRYLREFKRRFDPGNASDGSAYIEPEPLPPEEMQALIEGRKLAPVPEEKV